MNYIISGCPYEFIIKIVSKFENIKRGMFV